MPKLKSRHSLGLDLVYPRPKLWPRRGPDFVLAIVHANFLIVEFEILIHFLAHFHELLRSFLGAWMIIYKYEIFFILKHYKIINSWDHSIQKESFKNFSVHIHSFMWYSCYKEKTQVLSVYLPLKLLQSYKPFCLESY